MTTRQRWTMVAAILGSGIVFLDGTVVNVALEKIGKELPASVVGVLEGQTYVTSGYLAVLAALLILAGALADFYGRRRVFAIGLAGFGLTSALCGLAPNLELLIVFRLLQGAAGALLVPGSLSIITATFEGEARSRAFGIWASATSATTILGPIVGGFLVDNLSWRLAFLINLPLVAIALFATIRFMEETRDEEAGGRFDWLGAAVIAFAVGGLAFGAIRGQEKQWSDSVAFISLGVGLVCAIAFPFLMARSSHPLVPLRLFRSRGFAVINLSTFLIYGALYVSLGYQPLFLQGTLSYTAFAAGTVGLPVGVMLTIFSTRVGSIAGRIGARPFLTAGPLIMAAGFLWLSRIPVSSEPWRAQLDKPATLVPSAGFLIDVLPAVILFGIGISFIVAPLTNTLMGSIPVRNAGLGSAINNAISRVGQPLLGAILFIVITGTFYGSLAAKVPGLDTSSPTVRHELAPLNEPKTSSAVEAAAARQASTDAFHLAMYVGTVLLLAGAAVNAIGIPRMEAKPAGEDQATSAAAS